MLIGYRDPSFADASDCSLVIGTCYNDLRADDGRHAFLRHHKCAIYVHMATVYRCVHIHVEYKMITQILYKVH